MRASARAHACQDSADRITEVNKSPAPSTVRLRAVQGLVGQNLFRAQGPVPQGAVPIVTSRVDEGNSAEFGIKEKVVSNIGTRILKVTQHFSTSHTYFLPYKCLSANLFLFSKSRIKLGLPGEAESCGPNGELSSRVLPKEGWARRQ